MSRHGSVAKDSYTVSEVSKSAEYGVEEAEAKGVARILVDEVSKEGIFHIYVGDTEEELCLQESSTRMLKNSPGGCSGLDCIVHRLRAETHAHIWLSLTFHHLLRLNNEGMHQ